MIQAGKRKKEFADPYTVTGAVTKGNIITKLSLLIMGLGNIAQTDRKGTDVSGC